MDARCRGRLVGVVLALAILAIARPGAHAAH